MPLLSGKTQAIILSLGRGLKWNLQRPGFDHHTRTWIINSLLLWRIWTSCHYIFLPLPCRTNTAMLHTKPDLLGVRYASPTTLTRAISSPETFHGGLQWCVFRWKVNCYSRVENNVGHCATGSRPLDWPLFVASADLTGLTCQVAFSWEQGWAFKVINIFTPLQLILVG